MKAKKFRRYEVQWEENGSGWNTVNKLFSSKAQADKFMFESEDIPYGVKKARTGSYTIELVHLTRKEIKEHEHPKVKGGGW